MAEELGQQIVVRTSKVPAAPSRPARWPTGGDGYPVLLHHIGMSTAPGLYRNLAYSPLEDFKTIGLVTDVPMTIIARKDFPPEEPQGARGLRRRTNKDKVTYANAGVGAASHLCGLLFETGDRGRPHRGPVQGTGPAMTDLVGGQVDFMCDQTTNTARRSRRARSRATP